MRSGSGAQFLCVKPAIPHKFEHLSTASQKDLPALPPLLLQQFLSQGRSAPLQDTSLIPRQPAPLPRTPAPRRPSAPRSPLHPEHISRQSSRRRSSKPTQESQN